MSLIDNTKEKDNRIVNVEGILADFFLEKIKMEESISEDDSGERKRKKHKKHKSKKLKSKYKTRNSHSSERKSKDYPQYADNYSSSEEKDIQRLQRLKKLDSNNKFSAACLPVTEISSNNNMSKINAESSILSDIPYGPSLETLLAGTTASASKNQTVEINDTNSKVTENSSKTENNITDASISTSKKLNTCEILPIKNLVSSTSNKICNDSSVQECSNPNDTLQCTSESKVKVESKQSHSRSRSLSGDEGKNLKSRSIKSEKQHSRSRSRNKSRKRSHSRSRSHSHNRSRSRRTKRSRSKDYGKRYNHTTERKRSRSISRRRRRTRSRSNSSERVSSRSSYKRYRSRSRDRSRYSSHEDSKYSSKSHKRRDSSSDYESRKERKRSRSKSIEKERSNSHKIDQAKIRQLAQKNVLSMIEKGTLPEGLSVENLKKEQVSLKAGGKSVQELTDFCAQLSKKENDPIDNDSNANGNDNNEDSAFIHHPFKIKESSTIKMNIKNAVQIPIKTHAEKVAETARLSSQFPVSSGDQHRKKELEWIPVEPSSKVTKTSNDTKAIVPVSQPSIITPALSQQQTNESIPHVKESEPLPVVIPASIPLPIPVPSIPALPPPPQPPVLPTLPPDNSAQLFNPVNQPLNTPLAIDYSTNFSSSFSTQQTFTYPTGIGTNNFLLPTPTASYFPQPSYVYPVPTMPSSKPKKPIDVTTVVSERFKALTKLQSNPNDPEALQALEHAQASIQDWVQSQQVPGLFTGSTGAKPLSVEQLSGPRHWVYRAKKDIFIRAAPVTEGKGMSLLKKMGWNPGEGLGKNKEGSLEPLVLDIKTDKKGLVSEGEGSKRIVSSVVKDLQGKHPVSALMELCSKRKWKPPLYTLIKESGPPHKKLFLFKVEVNNAEYQSANPVNNKKVAKADAAVICLQTLSVFPKS